MHAVFCWGPGDAIQNGRALGVDLLSDQHHGFALKVSFERKQRSGVADPGLVPHFATGVVDIEAAPCASLSASPVLLNDAVAIDSFHEIVPLKVALWIVDGPVSYPEIELTVFGRGAGLWRCLAC